MSPCICGHGRWAHLGYVGGCGSCSCAAFREPRVNFTTTTNTTTEEQPS